MVDLKGISPDDAFSAVPYEKGHTLLFHLEELVGGAGNSIIELFLKIFKVSCECEFLTRPLSCLLVGLLPTSSAVLLE